MPRITSLLKSICGKIMAIPMKLTKRMYRQMALLTVGGAVVSVVAFSSNGFAGSGKNAVSAEVVNSAEEAQVGEDTEEEISGILDIAGLNTTIAVEDLHLLLLSDEITVATKSNALSLDIFNIGDRSDDKSKKSTENELPADENQGTNENETGEGGTEADSDTELVNVEQGESANERMVRLLEERREALDLPSLTVEDYTNLLRIVEAEVGDNDVYGRTIVANVVINRVRSTRFENTITDVIFSPGQFSPIRDRRFYKVKVSETTIKGVNKALLGEDNSRGALYFMDRAYSTNHAVGWFDSSLTYLFSYGGHEYFK